jgi:RNA polymerase-binding transcription factor DksA
MATKTSKTKLKYNQKELAEFKAIIDVKLEKARKEYDIFKGSISRNDDHGTDDTSPTFKVLEEGSEVLSKEENAQLASRQQKFIEHLEHALMRIKNGTYGMCRQTGKLISKERLKAVPHATLSIEAKQAQ